MQCNNDNLGPAVLMRGLVAGLLLTQCGLAFGASVGQIDHFSDGTLQGWAMGRSTITASHMANLASGGPDGAADRYLAVSSDGTSVAGGRPSFFNKAQWTGDFIAAGITAIAVDLKNFSSTDTLHMRLAIEGGPDVLTGGLFATSDSVTLVSGADWTRAIFSLAPEDLVAVSGRSGNTGNDVQAALGNVVELRMLNSLLPDWAGVPVQAVLGIDNVTAVSGNNTTVVPLPAAFWLFGSGVSLLLLLARRGRRE